MPKAKKTPTKKTVRLSTARQPAKPQRARAVRKSKAKTTATKKNKIKVKRSQPVPPPVVTTPLPTTASTITTEPTLTAPSTLGYKELPPPANRFQLWLAVSATFVIILVVWLTITQRKLVNLPTTLSHTIENAQVDSLVNDIKTDYGNLQNTMGSLTNLTDPATNQTATPDSTTATTNTTSELNNLFSDLQ